MLCLLGTWLAVFVVSASDASLAVSVSSGTLSMTLQWLVFLHFRCVGSSPILPLFLASAWPRMVHLAVGASLTWQGGAHGRLGLRVLGLKEGRSLFGGILADIFPIPLRMSEKPRKFAVGKE